MRPFCSLGNRNDGYAVIDRSSFFDIYTIHSKLLPFGNFERISSHKSSILSEILDTPVELYLSDFVDYFINDEYSLKQVLHHISLKPSNESALMKCTSLDSTQVLRSSGTLCYEEDVYGQGSYSTDIVECANVKETTYCRMINDESLELYEKLIGSSNIDEISRSIDNELSGHYCKINQYQSFFIDVTKLLISMPKLGYDLMASPQVMLNILDHIIIPILYSLVENICLQYKVNDVASVMKLYRTIPCHLSYMLRSKNVSNVLQNTLESLDVNDTGFYANNFPNSKPFKFNITTRLKNVLPTADVWRQSVNEIQDDDVGQMITVTATVILTGALNVLEEEREYICKKCQKSFICKSLPELNFFVNIPPKCPNFSGLPSINIGQKCDGAVFVKGTYNRRSDYQEIRCQSMFNRTNYMNMNSIIPAVLRREIAGTCFPGDIVHIVAFVRRRWKKLKRGDKCDSEIFLDVINLDIINWKSLNSVNMCESFKSNLYERFWSANRHCEINARNVIIDGFCPSLVDLDNAKLALILTAIGGFSVDSILEENKDNRWSKYSDKRNELRISLGSSNGKEGCSVKKRGSRTQCHILFLGDPGTGKSQLLKHAGNLSFRHIFVSGTNCTSVGLTCTLIRDGPEAMLAAGALVLAAGGVCSIDEFASIRAEDKSCLHEAMEQQVISVAKAGIKCTLNCQCTIVAASNVKFSKSKSSSTVVRDLGSSFDSARILNINVPLPLLSRFDLIVVFTDNSTNDIDLTEFLLSESSNQKGCYNEHDMHILDWSVGSTIKEYVNFVKENIFPSLTGSVKVLIDSYYTELRKCSMESKYGGGPTVRTIESLVRLSQAHARLMFRDIVTLFDIVSVIWILEFGLQGFSIGCNNGNEQILDRQGLFPNIKQIFSDYAENACNESPFLIGDKKVCRKLTNGIQTESMYDYFEGLLLSRLSLKKVQSHSEEDGIALIPETENQMYYT